MTTHSPAHSSTQSLPVSSPVSGLPYAPSWVDRLTDWLERLPGSVWGFYLAAALLLNLLNASLEWRIGSYPVGTFDPAHLVTAGSCVGYLALIHYLDRAAGRALVKYQPAFDSERGNPDELRYRLTTMPARSVRRVTAAGILYGLGVGYTIDRGWVLPNVVAFEAPTTAWLDWLVIVSANVMMMLFIYHTIHQLRIINHVYTTCTHIDIFHLTPLYAFAGLAARTALGWLATAYIWLIAMPPGAPDSLLLANTLVVALLGLVAFIWPLVGIHRLLEEEKTRHQVAVRRRVQAAMEEMHRRVDVRRFDETVPITELLTGLKQEMDILDQIPTWPWQPELFRTVLTAVLLPILLWFITRAIERFVAF
ncbi:MAG: hypothetical protein DCC57_07225 [Chloroflexi bacterium]|nr:MAG: hypothetical protein DCC57_07225 [Chloroflexota bacterium]